MIYNIYIKSAPADVDVILVDVGKVSDHGGGLQVEETHPVAVPTHQHLAHRHT
jgi:hypothetical protein